MPHRLNFKELFLKVKDSSFLIGIFISFLAFLIIGSPILLRQISLRNSDEKKCKQQTFDLQKQIDTLEEDLEIKEGQIASIEALVDGSNKDILLPNSLSEWPEEGWFLYENKNHGFTMRFPKEVRNVFTYAKECKGEMLPVKIFEDSTNVYPSTEYFYQRDYQDTECEKIENTVQIMKSGDYYQNTYWEMFVGSVHNIPELKTFVKSKTGEGCVLSDLSVTEQEGVYDVDVIPSYQGDDIEKRMINCPVNRLAIKYYPEKNTVVAWEMGQGVTFLHENISEDMIVDSFRFE